LALYFPNTASAQSSAELRLSESSPWLAKNNGPTTSKGIIYFIGGHIWPPPPDGRGIAPYFLKTLGEQGWDILRAKVPYRSALPPGVGRPLPWLLAPGAALFVKRRVSELRAQGYRRVILAGHSWGGWVLMIADQSKGLGADALVLSAPATYGPQNPMYGVEFRTLMKSISTPTVLLTFAGDNLEAGGRAKAAEALLNASKTPHLIIGEPRGFSGHFAGWLPFFDYAFGKCISQFIEDARPDPCQPPPLTNDDYRSILSIQQVPDAENMRIVSAESLLGRKFTAFRLGEQNTNYDYQALAQRTRRESGKAIIEAVTFRDELHCIGRTCSKLVKWSDLEILEFDPVNGGLRAWWVER